MLVLIVKLFDLFEALLDYFVVVQWSFSEPTRDSGYQWTGQINSIITDKGWAVMDDLVTIIHNALDMVAQFSVMFPAPYPSGNTDQGLWRLEAPF